MGAKEEGGGREEDSTLGLVELGCSQSETTEPAAAQKSTRLVGASISLSEIPPAANSKEAYVCLAIDIEMASI